MQFTLGMCELVSHQSGKNQHCNKVPFEVNQVWLKKGKKKKSQYMIDFVPFELAPGVDHQRHPTQKTTQECLSHEVKMTSCITQTSVIQKALPSM